MVKMKIKTLSYGRAHVLFSIYTKKAAMTIAFLMAGTCGAA